MSAIEAMDAVPPVVVPCPQCALENRPQRKFCAKCGTSLWDTCFECGEPSAAAATYCGGCGANLQKLGAELHQRMETDFRTAAQMRSEYRYDQAVALLLPISKNGHPRLADMRPARKA
jgi:predicted amidophosphoribosyltransferase